MIQALKLSIFQDGGRRRLSHQEGRTASQAKFRQNRSNRGWDTAIFNFLPMSSRSLEPRPSYGDFLIFQRWRPSAILDL